MCGNSLYKSPVGGSYTETFCIINSSAACAQLSGICYNFVVRKMIQRFQSDKTIYHFAHEFLVKCPRCLQCAYVKDQGRDVSPHIILRCPSCSYSRQRQHQGGEVVIGAAVDWYFHLPLWLQTPCCGKNLWAYNYEHLTFIENFVGAKHRENLNGKYGWSNGSLTNRLPLWIKQAKNRDGVLRSIKKMRQTS